VNLYLDASALLKRYLLEPGSAKVGGVIARADIVGSSIISRAEVAAALAKAVRMHALTQDGALQSLQLFRNQWPDFARVQATELVVGRADAFAWEHGLRGYDAVHLASASVWQDSMGDRVTMATFDRTLWTVSGTIGLDPFPPDLPSMLEHWRNTQDEG
jgi:predicted nucleic acid-binding protein